MDAMEPLKRLANPDNLVDRIAEAEKANLVQPTSIGDFLSETSGNTGDLIVGNLISPAPEVEVMDVTSTDFTGSFMSGEGATFDGETYNIGGVNAGVLQFGLSQTDGKAYAGAGAVTLDEDGITVITTTATNDTNSYKLVDASSNVVGIFQGYTTEGSSHTVQLKAPAVTGLETNLDILAEASGSDESNIYIQAGTVQISMNAPLSRDTIFLTATTIYLSVTNIQTATGYISSGTYTPTATGVTNIGTSSSWAANYYRVHNMVTVWGTAGIDPTATATLTEVRITLPVASAFTTSSDLSGTMGRNSSATGLGLVVADTTNDQALLRWVTDSAASVTYNFHFSYIIK